MKKVMRQCTIIAAVMTCICILVLFSCDLIPGKGSLDLTIQSDIDPNDIDSYDITLNGPESKVETKKSITDEVQFTDLTTGLWSINVKVKAETDTVLGEGNDHIIIEKDKTVGKTVKIIIYQVHIEGEKIIKTGDPTTFTLPLEVISLTYSKVTVIGGGGGGDGGWACGTSSGAWVYFGGGGGAGEVKTETNVIEIGETYTLQPGSGGRGGSGNESSMSCPGLGCNSDDGRPGQDSTFSGESINIVAHGGTGAECQSGGSGYPSGTSGSQCFSSAIPNPVYFCDRTPPEGTGGDNGTEYGNGGDGNSGSSTGEDGEDGVIIIEWEGFAMPE